MISRNSLWNSVREDPAQGPTFYADPRLIAKFEPIILDPKEKTLSAEKKAHLLANIQLMRDAIIVCPSVNKRTSRSFRRRWAISSSQLLDLLVVLPATLVDLCKSTGAYRTIYAHTVF